MKKILFTLFVAQFAILGAFAQETTQPAVPENPNAPVITFNATTIDYGTIEYNADGLRAFEFKNEGKEPLIISNCKGSCGCTVPTWPKEPIMPGASAKIEVKYATNRVGQFNKTVTVTSNAKVPNVTLIVKGNVLPAPVAPEANPAEKPAVPTAQ
jgi:hypothetical protein